MTKKTRVILICVLVSLFFLITPIAILYSQGYRYDFENKKITQTGGLFLKVSPRSADIYLDDILMDKTDFLFGSVLIENLMPKKYKIRVEKENCFSWEKTLEIKEKQVTNAKNITLLTKNPEFFEIKLPEDRPLTILEKISPDKKKELCCNDYEIWVLFLEKQEEQPKRDIGDKVFLTRFSKKISDIFWLTSHYLIFEIENQIKIIEIDNRDKINVYDIYDLGKFENPKMSWNQDDKKLYVLDNNKLFVSEELIR